MLLQSLRSDSWLILRYRSALRSTPPWITEGLCMKSTTSAIAAWVVLWSALFARYTANPVPFLLQLVERHLLMPQAISKQLPVQPNHSWLAAFKWLLCL